MISVARQVAVHDIILHTCRGKHRGTRVLYGCTRRDIKLQIILVVAHHLLYSGSDAGIHHKLVIVILCKTLMLRVLGIGPCLLETQSDGIYRQCLHIANHQAQSRLITLQAACILTHLLKGNHIPWLICDDIA